MVGNLGREFDARIVEFHDYSLRLHSARYGIFPIICVCLFLFVFTFFSKKKIIRREIERKDDYVDQTFLGIM